VLTTLDEIRAARASLPPFVRETPIVPVARSPAEVGNERLWVKCENLQVTGAHKIRAASTVLASLDSDLRARGVVLTSSGNFGLAFAYAGREIGVPICVVLLEGTSRRKVEATRGYGAEVVFCSEALKRQLMVEHIATERGITAVDTWEERPIIAGHGTLGLEILEQFPGVEQILVPVSSGGVAAGVATAVKLTRPEVRVVGVQPVDANAAYVSLKAGEPTAIDYWDSIADGLSARRPGRFPFAHLQTHLDEIVLVSDRDIGCAFEVILSMSKLLSEPAGAVAAAGFLAKRVDTNLRSVAVLTGGNMTRETLHTLLALADGS